MARRKITDPRLLAELQDAFDAQEAGVDYETVKRSSGYRASQNTPQPNAVQNANRAKAGLKPLPTPKRKSYSGFGNTDDSGTIRFLRGAFGRPAESLFQMGANIGNKLGLVSDEDKAYYDAAPKIAEQRAKKARGGKFDLAGTLGMLATPIPGPAKMGPVARAAYQGAVGSTLQPVTDGADNLFKAKAEQAAIGGAVGAGTGALLNKLATRATKPKVPSVAKQRLEAADRLDLDNFGYAMASDSPVIGQFANFSSKVPGGGPLQKASNSVNDQLGDKVYQLADRIGNKRGTSYEVGSHVRKGLKGFVGSFRDKADDLYAQVDDSVPRDYNFVMPRTLQALNGRANDFDNKALGQLFKNPRFKSIFDRMVVKDDVDDIVAVAPMSYRDVRHLRSEIGEMLGDSEIITKVPKRQIYALYGAISDDIADGLAETGNPQAIAKFKRANNYWRAGRERIDNVLEGLMDEKSPAEDVVRRISNMVKKDSKGTSAVRRSLKDDEWGEVAGYLFRQLGETTPANTPGPDDVGFSTVKLLNDYKTLRKNKRAFDFAFGGTQYEHLAPIYNDMAVVADALKGGAKLANTSGSGYYVGLAGLVGAAFTNPMLVAKIVGSNRVFAELMANPKFARWLTGAGKKYIAGQSRGATVANAMAKAHIERLPAIAASEGFEEELDRLNKFIMSYSQGEE